MIHDHRLDRSFAVFQTESKFQQSVVERLSTISSMSPALAGPAVRLPREQHLATVAFDGRVFLFAIAALVFSANMRGLSNESGRRRCRITRYGKRKRKFRFNTNPLENW